MKIFIEMDIDVSGIDDRESVDDMISEWTRDIRVSRLLNSWSIKYDVNKAL